MKGVLAAMAASIVSLTAQADSILLTNFGNEEYSGTNVYNQMAATLTGAGHTVTIVDARVAGNVAAALGSASYDQVFLWDLTSTSYLSAGDVNALSSFWNSNRGLVVDTRSYGYYYQGANASEVALLQNVASQLALSGGGVWVGTDHHPGWAYNGNLFLSAIGVNTVTGIFSNPVNFADPSSVLLAGVTPTDLWAAGQSVGQAPIGVQPNVTTEMFIHFGHTGTDGSILPYISASFPLEGVDPNPVPEPSSLALLAIAAAGALMARRRPRRSA